MTVSRSTVRSDDMRAGRSCRVRFLTSASTVSGPFAIAYRPQHPSRYPPGMAPEVINLRSPDDDWEALVNILVIALAAQVSAGGTPPTLTPNAAAVLTDFRRFQARTFFGVAGHLVHYDDYPEVEVLAQLVTALQRESAVGDGVRPGDRVRLVGELPATLRVNGNEDAWRAATFVVRYVGDDGIAEIQPDFVEDYLVETVPVTALSLVD
jgi:hypothetical protein